MRLSELKSGDVVIIEQVDGACEKVTQRLFKLGLQVGQRVTCLGRSPAGGVMAFRLTHGDFALEDTIIQNVVVKKADNL